MREREKMPDYKYTPEPIPVLKGKAAKEFLKRIKQGPTEKQKKFMVEAEKTYAQIKKRRVDKSKQPEGAE